MLVALTILLSGCGSDGGDTDGTDGGALDAPDSIGSDAPGSDVFVDDARAETTVTDAAHDGGDASSDTTTTEGGPPPGWVKLPCDLTIGTGAGRIDVSASTGKTGDVICIRAGSYSGGSIQGVSDRTVQNDGGVVTITGIVELGNTKNVTLSGSGHDAAPYGFVVTGTAASFVITGPNEKLVAHDFEAIGAGILFDAGHTGLVWKGSDAELVLHASRFDRIRLKSSGQLFQGNYGSMSSLTNFASGLEMSNVIVDDSKGTGQNVVSGGGIFDLNAHDWTITGPNTVVVGSGDDRDTGVFSFGGSGVVRRMHRDGGWGWLVRNFGAQLGTTRGEFRCENNVDLNTEYYGTCESRTNVTPDSLPAGKLSTIDVFIRDNVSAHKRDIKGSYTTAIGLIPNLLAGTTATLTNNVGCDNTNDYGDVDSLHFWEVDGTVVKSGNEARASCAGLMDPITKKPL